MDFLPGAILWDLDGTIVDTKACHFYTWQFALGKFGFVLEKRVFDENFGRNNLSLLPLYLGFQPDHDLAEAIINTKEVLFRQIAQQEVRLVPHVESWLADASRFGILQAIASSAPMENIITLLEVFNLQHYFQKLIPGGDLPAKPEPDIFIIAAQKLGRLPKDCLVVEDSLAGVQAAKQARMKCVAVTTSHEKEELCIADLVVADYQTPLEQVIPLLFQ